jgi:hypothetical protein
MNALLPFFGASLSFFARFACPMFTECSLGAHRMLTQCVHWRFTERSQDERAPALLRRVLVLLCSLRLPNVHWMFTGCSQDVPWICSLKVHWMLTEYVHWMFTEYVYWMFTGCSLNVHWMSNEPVHWTLTEGQTNTFTECSLNLFTGY